MLRSKMRETMMDAHPSIVAVEEKEVGFCDWVVRIQTNRVEHTNEALIAARKWAADHMPIAHRVRVELM